MLVNLELANKKLATEFGHISFNEKGESKDLKAEQEKKLAKLPGFKHVADKVEEKKEAAPKEEPKAEEKRPSTRKRKSEK
jgi:hypothetical protein